MILIVDDDPSVLFSLRVLLVKEGHEVSVAHDAGEALPYIRRGEPELIISDMNFSNATSGEEGLHFLSQIRIFMPEVPVILITAWGSIDLAVEGMKRGAFDFMTKPWDTRELLRKVATALTLSSDKTNRETSLSPSAFDRGGIIGSSPGLKRLLDSVRRVAPTDASVLLLGENGTGKEMIAEAIHRNSVRADKPFVKVNLGGIPSSLFESEMFGHVKGAFTGAVAERKGRFEMADGGTIFLDEIGELDLSSQVKLLRVLQEQTFEPLGDSRSRKIDVRVVCATNADLESLVAEGKFREDLYYRINLIQLHLPPLRERKEDLPALAAHFAEIASRENSLPLRGFSDEALEILSTLSFPGNIRQLSNIVRRAVIMAPSELIGPENLALTPSDKKGIGNHSSSFPSEGGTLEDMECQAIKEALERHDGNLSRTAVALGITRQSLYRRMQKFGF